MIPRKTVPRRSKWAENMETDSGDESRMSTTSTVKAVDHFCREYRPPSVALHRLSYLDKELPAPPLSESPTRTPNQSNTLSRTSTEKHVASQNVVSIHSRYSTRVNPSTPSRLSTITSEQRDSEDRVSVRCRYSTHDPISAESAVSRSEPNAIVTIDSRRPSGVVEHSKKDARRQYSGSISPSTIQYHKTSSEEAGQEGQVLRPQKTEMDPWALQDPPLEPLVGSRSREIVTRSRSKRKTFVGWTFHDGLVLKTGTTHTSGSPGLELKSKRMVPIRWSFHDGIIFRANDSPKSGNLESDAKPKRMIPIGWSFYDGLTPIGWTFHDGLIFTTHDSVQNALKSSDKRKDIELEARWKRLPITWTFHDGLILRTDAKVNDTTKRSPSDRQVVTRKTPKRTVGWTFNDGLMVRTNAGTSSKNKAMRARTKSKRTVTWTFNDGLMIRSKAGTSPNNGNLASRTKSKRSFGWTFNDGLTLRTDGGLVKSSSGSRGMATGIKSKRIPVKWNFYDGLTVQRGASTGKGKAADRSLHPSVSRRSAQHRRITFNFWDGVTFRIMDGASARVSTRLKSKFTSTFNRGLTRTTLEENSNQPKPKRTYGWTFYDCFTVKTIDGAENLRLPRSIAPANSPTPQPTTDGIPDIEQELDLSPRKITRDGVSDIPDVSNEPVLNEKQLDPSPMSKPLPPSSSSSGASYFSAQPGTSSTEIAAFQDRHRRPPASRANTRIEPSTNTSKKRFTPAENGRDPTANASERRSTPITNSKLTSPDPLLASGRKVPRSKLSLEAWDGDTTTPYYFKKQYSAQTAL